MKLLLFRPNNLAKILVAENHLLNQEYLAGTYLAEKQNKAAIEQYQTVLRQDPKYAPALSINCCAACLILVYGDGEVRWVKSKNQQAYQVQ